MTVTVRTVALSATLGGVALTSILSASCTYSWRRPFPTATVEVSAVPGGADYDQELVLVMGAGNNVTRFKGLLRDIEYPLFPRWPRLSFVGYMARAAEFQNWDDPNGDGGLLIDDLIGSSTGTDADIVKAVLTKANVPYTGANIGGTGSTFGTVAEDESVFLWRAGGLIDSDNDETAVEQEGETALAYIERWDKASAVYTNATSPLGFYRTYETPNGVYRSLIGGRPRSTPVHTFTEGTDILAGQARRSYPTANSVLCSGLDQGDSEGPAFYAHYSSNPYMSGGVKIPVTYGSPFLEVSEIADESGGGVSCERAAKALEPDLNRITVVVQFQTHSDALILTGETVLVQAAGGAVDRLGTAEPLLVDEVTCGVDENGFVQSVTATGGGLPDDYTPAPAG